MGQLRKGDEVRPTEYFVILVCDHFFVMIVEMQG